MATRVTHILDYVPCTVPSTLHASFHWALRALLCRSRKWRLNEIKKPSSNSRSLTSEASVLNHYTLLPLQGWVKQLCLLISNTVKSDYKPILFSFSQDPMHTQSIHRFPSVEIKVALQPCQWDPGCLQWPCEAGTSIREQPSYMACQVTQAKPKCPPKKTPSPLGHWNYSASYLGI